MKFDDLDKTKKYADGIVSFVNHKGKYIMETNYTNLEGKRFIESIDKSDEFEASIESDGKSILNLVVFTGSKATPEILSRLQQSAIKFNTKHVNKTAATGLTPLQKIFAGTFIRMNFSDVGIFNTKEEAYDWLVED